MYRDRFSEFGLHKKEDVEESGVLMSQKGIISWGGKVFGRDFVRSSEGSVLGEYGISSPRGGISAYGNIISWKGDILAREGIESRHGEIYARKIVSGGPVKAEKITADEVTCSYIICGSLRSRGAESTKIKVVERKGGTEASCYVGIWIERLFMDLPVYGLDRA